MDTVFVVTTLISIITNVIQFILGKKYYNIIYLHPSLIDQYDLSDSYEYTDYTKARRMSRQSAVIHIGSDPSKYKYDWIILPEGASEKGPKVLYSPSEKVIRGLLNG